MRIPPLTLVAVTFGPPPLTAAVIRWLAPSPDGDAELVVHVDPAVHDGRLEGASWRSGGTVRRTPPFVVETTTSPGNRRQIHAHAAVDGLGRQRPGESSPVMPPLVVATFMRPFTLFRRTPPFSVLNVSASPGGHGDPIFDLSDAAGRSLRSLGALARSSILTLVRRHFLLYLRLLEQRARRLVATRLALRALLAPRPAEPSAART